MKADSCCLILTFIFSSCVSNPLINEIKSNEISVDTIVLKDTFVWYHIKSVAAYKDSITINKRSYAKVTYDTGSNITEVIKYCDTCILGEMEESLSDSTVKVLLPWHDGVSFKSWLNNITLNSHFHNNNKENPRTVHIRYGFLPLLVVGSSYKPRNDHFAVHRMDRRLRDSMINGVPLKK